MLHWNFCLKGVFYYNTTLHFFEAVRGVSKLYRGCQHVLRCQSSPLGTSTDRLKGSRPHSSPNCHADTITAAPSFKLAIINTNIFEKPLPPDCVVGLFPLLMLQTVVKKRNDLCMNKLSGLTDWSGNTCNSPSSRKERLSCLGLRNRLIGWQQK